MNSGLVTIDGRSGLVARRARRGGSGRRAAASSGRRSCARARRRARRRAIAASTWTVESGPSGPVGVLTQTNVNGASGGGSSSVVKVSEPSARPRGDRLGQAGLEDRRPALVEVGDPGGVEVGDGDAMAEPGEADRGDQADVAGTEQEEVHEAGISGVSRRCPDECRNDSIRRAVAGPLSRRAACRGETAGYTRRRARRDRAPALRGRPAVDRGVRFADLPDRADPPRARPRGHGAGPLEAGAGAREIHPVGYPIVRVEATGRRRAAVPGADAADPARPCGWRRARSWAAPAPATAGDAPRRRRRTAAWRLPHDRRRDESDAGLGPSRPGRPGTGLPAGCAATSVVARIFLMIRSHRRRALAVAPPADVYHGMAYMGISVALALGQAAPGQGRLRLARHLHGRRQPGPPARSDQGGPRPAGARLGARRRSRLHRQPAVRRRSSPAGSAWRCRSSS